MSAMPKKMMAGLGIGLAGGIVALGAMAYAWDGSLDSLTAVGINMLISILFFAVAGCFTKEAPVAGNSIAVISAVCFATIVLAFLCDTTMFWVILLLGVLAVAEIAVACCPTVVRWVDSVRVA